MRDYFKMSPMFWSGQTGRRLRELGGAYQLLAAYICFAPTANRLGLYYLPVETIDADLGKIPRSRQTQTPTMLGVLQRLDFAYYDKITEFIWVARMAGWQNLTDGEPLEPTDNRVKGLRKAYRQLPPNPFLGPFFDFYEDIFHLTDRRDHEPPRRTFAKVETLRSPFGDPSEGLPETA